jgi:acyl carrier protein
MSGRLYDIISRVMSVPASGINDESGPETIENWDSFSGFILLNELETTFKVKFTLDEALSTKNVEGIKMNLAKRGVVLE